MMSLNSFSENYSNKCFSFLHKAHTKTYLNILEAIVFTMQQTSLCRQRELTLRLKLQGVLKGLSSSSSPYSPLLLLHQHLLSFEIPPFIVFISINYQLI